MGMLKIIQYVWLKTWRQKRNLNTVVYYFQEKGKKNISCLSLSVMKLDQTHAKIEREHGRIRSSRITKREESKAPRF